LPSKARSKLLRSDPVLVRVVTIRYFERKSAVAVAFPSSAEINRVVYASNFKIAADAEANRIVLAVAHIGKSDLPENRCVKGTRRSEAIDAKGIVPPVLTRPFAMSNKSRRNLAQ